MNRSYQRQTVTFLSPVRRMITLVPTPFAVSSTIAPAKPASADHVEAGLVRQPLQRRGRVRDPTVFPHLASPASLATDESKFQFCYPGHFDLSGGASQGKILTDC
jgi:hypothetical protein